MATPNTLLGRLFPTTSTPSTLEQLRASNAPARTALQNNYQAQQKATGNPSATSPFVPPVVPKPATAKDQFVDRLTSTNLPAAPGTSGGPDPATVGSQIMQQNKQANQPAPSAPPAPAADAPSSKSSSNSLPGQDSAYKDAYTAYIQSLAPGKDSTAAKQKYLDFIQQRDLGLQQIEDKPIPMRFVTGQQASVQKLADIQGNRLQGDVQLAQDAEKNTQNALLARLNFEQSLKKDQEDKIKLQEEKNKPVEVGGSLVNPSTGEVIYKGEGTKAQPTASIQEYEYAKNNGYTGSFTDYQNEDANRKNKLAASGLDESSPLVSSIISNPELFNQLTATDKAKVIPALNALGFTAFGKPLSDTAISNITQTEMAIEQLNRLKQTFKDNAQYIGPISGLQALNPYSKAKQVQADINRVKQSVGKALEGGVLRKEDEEKYKQILATINDTPETAEYKVNQLIANLTANVEAYKTNQSNAGRNVSTSTSSGSGEFNW